MSFYKDVITQEMQAFLLSKDIDVDVQDKSTDDTLPDDMIKFSILVGNNPKLGGVYFSATINKFDLSESLQICQKILHAQLVLYAIECIKNGHRAIVPEPFVPELTETVIYPSLDEAKMKHHGVATTVAMYDVFKNSPFNKKNKLPKIK